MDDNKAQQANGQQVLMCKTSTHGYACFACADWSDMSRCCVPAEASIAETHGLLHTKRQKSKQEIHLQGVQENRRCTLKEQTLVHLQRARNIEHTSTSQTAPSRKEHPQLTGSPAMNPKSHTLHKEQLVAAFGTRLTSCDIETWWQRCPPSVSVHVRLRTHCVSLLHKSSSRKLRFTHIRRKSCTVGIAHTPERALGCPWPLTVGGSSRWGFSVCCVERIESGVVLCWHRFFCE